MGNTENTLVFKAKEYSFMQSVLADKPLTSQIPEIIQPSAVDIDTIVNEHIDNQTIKRALKENKPNFNIWHFSKMPARYNIEDAIRKGRYFLAETYSYNKKKALIAWPTTLLVSALVVRSLMVLNPPSYKFQFNFKSIKNLGKALDKTAIFNMLKLPASFYRAGITKDINENLYFLLFDKGYKGPFSTFYDVPSIILSLQEPTSNTIKRIRKDKSIKLLKQMITSKEDDYSRVKEVLNYKF